MSFLWVTIPVSLLVAGTLLALVLYAVRSGDFDDDWDEPAWRHLHDDDAAPELSEPRADGSAPPPRG